MYLLKFASMIRKRLPGASIVEFHSELCLPGKKAQRFFNRIKEHDGVDFIRLKSPDSIEIGGKKGRISIMYTAADGQDRQTTVDMVVLGCGVEGTGGDLAEMFDVQRDESGFFKEEHTLLDPVSSTARGVLIAGCAQCPKDIQNSVLQGKAAAGVILSQLVPGAKLQLEATGSWIDRDLCSGCRICMAACPFRAITVQDDGETAEINEVLCRGCGTCASACPAGAIRARHFTEKQIFEEIEALSKEKI
jgi:heterodisulfide reductase subunit A